MHKIKITCLLALTLLLSALHAQTIESFEYSTGDDLLAAWIPSGNTTASLSDSVATSSTGTKSMKLQFNFPSTAFATEWINGPQLASPLSINPAHYLSFRVKGDPAFRTADFKNLYLYAYDADGNFGRWGAAVPANDQWQVANYLASTIEKPWNSSALPDLSRIVQFAFYQYGSETAIPAYTATVHIDDLTVRETPLTEQPTGPIEQMIDGFEYPDATALEQVWSGTANARVALTTDISPRSSGTKALEATFTFPSTEWATEIVYQEQLANPVSIAPNQYVSFRLKGDPIFLTSDFRTGYLYVYDAAGNFGRWGIEPTSDNWSIVNFLASTIEKPWNSANLPDLNHIVQFAWYQYGSQTARPMYTATIAIDELQIRHTQLVDPPISTDKILEDFEYTVEEFPETWTGSAHVVISPSDDISHKATGPTSMRLDFEFLSTPWATEVARGPVMDTPVVFAPGQYVTYRIKGDPAFATADFRNIYLYVYDSNGNFGRWGAPVPITDVWRVYNFAVNNIEKPWDSPGLPDLNDIIRFAFYQYGSEAAIPAYSATVYLDEIMVRNTPLNEFPAPSAPREVLDTFESYADAAALLQAYTYVNSPSTTVTTADLASPAPEGSKALKLSIDFAAGQYPWGSIRAKAVAPFSFPSGAVLKARFQGDPSLAPVADSATTFWISLYDGAGRAIHHLVPAAAVTSGEWTNIEAPLTAFTDSATVDIGNLTSWRILVQGWEGTGDSAPASATFYVDDIRIVSNDTRPTLAVTLGNNGVTLSWPTTVTGYTLESTANFATWEPVANVSNNQVTVPRTGHKFFRLRK